MTPEAARTDLDTLFDELESSEPTVAMRWAVYGYVYGLHYAGVLDLTDLTSFLDRLGISGHDASEADVSL